MPEKDPGVDASQYKGLIEKELANHVLLQKMIIASANPDKQAASNRRSPAFFNDFSGIRRTDQGVIQSHGPNDFLVILNKMNDPFENYIPNDIYYAPKPCINWFDGCNEKGMMAPSLTRLDYLPF